MYDDKSHLFFLMIGHTLSRICCFIQVKRRFPSKISIIFFNLHTVRTGWHIGNHTHSFQEVEDEELEVGGLLENPHSLVQASKVIPLLPYETVLTNNTYIQ